MGSDIRITAVRGHRPSPTAGADAEGSDGGQRPGEIPLPPPEAHVHLLGSRAASVDRGRRRLAFVTLVMAFAFGVIGVRLVDLMVFGRGGDGAASYYAAPVLEARADLADRHGDLLATDLDSFALYIRRVDVRSVPETVATLKGVFPSLDPDRLAKRLENRRGQVHVMWDVSPAQKKRLLETGLPGLEFQRDVKRIYPNGDLAAHAIGYVNRAHDGILGAERAFEREIRRAAPDGTPVRLSLSRSVQHHLEHELHAAMDEFSAIGAMGVVLDVYSGEILALASLPAFNANMPLSGDDSRQLNKVTNGVYELGSVFKLITVAAGLELGAVDVDTVVDATKPYRVGRFHIRDFFGEERPLTVAEVVRYSSNIGAAKIAHLMDPDAYFDALRRFGLTDPSPVEVIEVAAPILPAQWEVTEQATVSFGYGLSVSPLQVASAVAAIANGGYLVAPTLRALPKGAPVKAVRVISERSAQDVLGLMRLVVEEGTGRRADVEGFPVAGKTGTAEKSVVGGYGDSDRISSFVGVFPAQAPQFLVYVVLDEPKPTKNTAGRATGGWTAAPTAGNIIRKIAPVLKVRPTRPASVQPVAYTPQSQEP
ncbi:MAG: penicillin-binding protein 2 [Pseudomonadota bacterium]